MPHSHALLRRITPSSLICLSLFLSLCQRVTLVSPAKTAETIKLPFAFRTRVGPMNYVLHEVQMPTWEGAILGGNRQTIVNNRHSAVVCAKTAEPIEVPFGLWARMGQKL